VFCRTGQGCSRSVGTCSMPPAMKRPAARMSRGGAAKEPVLKKPAAASGPSRHVNKLCNKVAAAISSSPEFPTEVKTMLADAINVTLTVPKEKRHAFQDNAIEMVRKVLDSLKATAQSKLDEAESDLETKCKDCDTHQSAVESARVALAERANMADAAKSEYTERTSARVAAKKALASAEQEQTSGNAGLLVTEDKKKRLDSGLETVFSPLKSGETPATDVQDGIQKIKTLAKDLGFDASLLQTVPAAFAKAPNQRGSFDNVVIEQLETEFQKCLATFSDELANGELARNERAAKVEVASAEHAQALASEEAAKSANEAARTAQKEAETEHKALSKAQQQKASDMASASAGVDVAKAELAELDEGPLAAFKELLDFTEIPPPAPSPAPEDPATAADATGPPADAASPADVAPEA